MIILILKRRCNMRNQGYTTTKYHKLDSIARDFNSNILFLHLLTPCIFITYLLCLSTRLIYNLHIWVLPYFYRRIHFNESR